MIQISEAGDWTLLKRFFRLEDMLLKKYHWQREEETMYGAVIGDVVGSTYEFIGNKTKSFPLFPNGSGFADDSILTIAAHKREEAYAQAGSTESVIL